MSEKMLKLGMIGDELALHRQKQGKPFRQDSTAIIALCQLQKLHVKEFYTQRSRYLQSCDRKVKMEYAIREYCWASTSLRSMTFAGEALKGLAFTFGAAARRIYV